MNFTFNVYGDKQIYSMTNRVSRGIQDFRPAWREMAESFFQEEEKQFAAQGRGPSGRWVALDKNYAKWKEKNYPGRPIMVLTGRLRDSLTGRGGQDTIYDITPMEMKVGSNVEYASVHQKGWPKRNIKKRPVIDLTDKTKNWWLKIIQNYVRKLVGGFK